MRTERSILERAGLASGLLNEQQIDRAWHVLAESLPADDLSLEEVSDQQLATQLIELGYLNRWQVEQLCQGRTKFSLGAYRILDAIGRGGMGWVFKGEHELLGRIEAIKVLPKNQSNPNGIASFRREIRAQALLDHPNLVRLSYADIDGSTYFLVTEYVPGSDLRRLVRVHGALTPQQAAIVVSQAAEAIHYAHAQGLIHRDVKPGNILITPEGQSKVADLGLAFFSADSESEGKIPSASKPKHIVGTADFLAPEIIVTPGEVLPISDIYSLGCTLYYALTGKVPFPGGETADKLRRHLDEEPIAVQRLNPEVDDRMAKVVAFLMQKRPADRVSTAAEVVGLLRPWVDSAAPSVRSTLGQMAKTSGIQDFQDASLADTKPVALESGETNSEKQPPPVLPVASAVETPNEPSAEPAPSTGLERATRWMIGLVAVAIVGTIYWIFFRG